ncbi:MAG: tetratricopeptide repeat protein, partial [Thermoanaerobaculia bacterium]
MIKRVILAVTAVLVVALIVLAIVLSRQRLRRHRVFQGPSQPAAKAPPGVPPVDQWTARFSALEGARKWSDLDDLLEGIEKSHPAEYAQWSLGYLHGRARLENNDDRGATQKLQPFLAAGNPFRDLALYHMAEVDDARGDGLAASEHRNELIAAYPDSPYRDQAIDDETEHLASGNDVAALEAFAAKVSPSADTKRRRDLQAHIIEMLAARGADGVLARGTVLLKGGTTDDASDRVSRALDKPELISGMTAEQLMLMGDSFQNHRHYDRAVAFLGLALRAMPRKSDDILFAIGRSWFGDEKYAEAQQTYLRGANATRDPKWKATFLFHGSRAAQLAGDDAGAERLMTAAIAVPGKFPATTAALTQRMRTRLKHNRIGEAAADLQLLNKIAPADHAVTEASLAYALAMVARNDNASAVRTLDSVPRKLLDKYDALEYAYWRARALESTDLRAAFASYLTVLRGTVPTHFAYFARERLDSPALAQKAEAEARAREAQAATLAAEKNFALAKQFATDRILLSSRDRAAALQRLAEIYRQLPSYREVLEWKPEDFPSFPASTPDRNSLLMAMGLFDETAESAQKRYPLRPAVSGLTQSLALNRGGASRQSIYAVEVLMNSVPDDFVPDLLPLVVRQ